MQVHAVSANRGTRRGRMRIGSLFSGIGGLELGLERGIPGSEVIWQVEKDPFCRRVLAKHWPHVTRFDDIINCGYNNLPKVDLICGGFPCQDVSPAGKKIGLYGNKSVLWFQFGRILWELKPQIVCVENVAIGKHLWLCKVRSDLHSIGYRTRAMQDSASDVGAPHKRERIFVVGYTDCDSKPIVSEHDETPRLQGLEIITPHWSDVPEFCRVDDGIPGRLDRLRVLGNAVVPQCAELIGRYIAGIC